MLFLLVLSVLLVLLLVVFVGFLLCVFGWFSSFPFLLFLPGLNWPFKFFARVFLIVVSVTPFTKSFICVADMLFSLSIISWTAEVSCCSLSALTLASSFFSISISLFLCS